MLIPDSGTEFFHPVKCKKIPDPDPHQRIYVFFTQKTVSKLSEERPGMFAPDPDPEYFSIQRTIN
jgi:hypothetical protein